MRITRPPLTRLTVTATGLLLESRNTTLLPLTVAGSSDLLYWKSITGLTGRPCMPPPGWTATTLPVKVAGSASTWNEPW